MSPKKPVQTEALTSIQNQFHAPKFIPSYAELVKRVANHRGLNPEVKVLVVLGAFDLLHIGHARYLAKCRSLADVVIVIVDTDAEIKIAKGNDRPVIPEAERAEMLAHLSYCDYVVYKDANNYDAKTGLWKIELPFRPNIIVVSKREPADDPVYLKKLEKICDKLVILESQATTSTSNKVRTLMISAFNLIESEFASMMTTIRAKLGLKKGDS
jgi:cytidyltransferase-like protein